MRDKRQRRPDHLVVVARTPHDGGRGRGRPVVDLETGGYHAHAVVAVQVFDVFADEADEEAGVQGVGGRGVDLNEVRDGRFGFGGGGRRGVEDVDDKVAVFDAHHCVWDVV